MLPNPMLLRKMIRQKMLDDGVSFPTPAALARFVEDRATAAEEQFHEVMAEIPEEEWKQLVAAQNAEPFGLTRALRQRENRIAALALAEVLEPPPHDDSEPASPTQARMAD